MRTRPDVLVLGGGGVLGEAWMMGVLAGLEDGSGFDLRDCESFVGTSAGAIVAAHLVAGRSPRRPSAVGTDLEVGHGQASRGLAVAAMAAAKRAGSFALAAGSTFAPLALGLAAPGGALVRSLLLKRTPPPPGYARPAALPDRGIGRPLRRPAAGHGGRPRIGPARGVRQPGAPDATVGRGGRGLVHGAVAVRPGRDRGARVRGRWHLEPDQPGCRAGRPGHARPVPEPDGQPGSHATRC